MSIEHRARRQAGLSIVIAHWNHLRVLPRALRSALNVVALFRGEGVGCEIVVIDDFSRDGSRRFLTALRRQRSDVFRIRLLPRNRSLHGARNAGFELASFHHALVLDADNELNPSGAFDVYRAARDTGAALAYGNLLDVIGGRVTGARSNRVATTDLYQQNYIDACAIVDVASVLRNGGLVDNMHGHEDWELALHFLADEQLVLFVPVVLGRYHLLESSMSASRTLEDAYRDIERVQRMYLQGLPVVGARVIGRSYHPDVGYLDEW